MGSVVRVIDGEVVPHRFISSRAYAAYGRGVHAEANLHYADALVAYTQATDDDPSGVEPWTRRGAVACRLKRFDEAEDAFSEAADRDDTFEPLWREKAICALQRGDVPAALSASERDVALDPDREEAVLLRASVLERAGDSPTALRELVGLTTRRPTRAAWQRQLALAERIKDEPAARLARNALAENPLANDPTMSTKTASATSLRDVDRALANGDLRSAERFGRAANLSPGMLAARAVALGKTDVGGEMGARIFAADPANADALIAALDGNQIERHPEAVEKVLDHARGQDLGTPSSLATLVLLEMLTRTIGPEARIGAHDLDVPRTDAVEEALRLRLTKGGAESPETPPSR